MAFNQNQVKDLFFADVTAAEAAGRPNEVCYVQSMKTFYDYVVAGSGYTVNHTSILSTGNGGDTRWRARSGQYVVDAVDFKDTITLAAGSTLQKALSGDIVLECDPSVAGTSAAALNAAAVGTFTKDIVVNLKDIAGNLHKWASLAVNAVASEVVVDGDVAAPAVGDATPDLVNGTITVTLTYDTDGGVTKTYAAGDTVTLTISAPTGGILGYPVANATFVDTIVA